MSGQRFEIESRGEYIRIPSEDCMFSKGETSNQFNQDFSENVIIIYVIIITYF